MPVNPLALILFYSSVSFKLFPMYFCPAALLNIGPARFRRFLVEHAPFRAVQEMREIVDTMYNTSVEILESKKRGLEEGDEATERQVEKGKDILSILCECFFFPGIILPGKAGFSLTVWVVRENLRADKNDKVEDEELIAQMS
jgi:hypothetical protein